MEITQKLQKEAIEILSKYDGRNSEILRLKRKLEENKPLKDLDYEYIIYNYKRQTPVLVDKIVYIFEWYGNTLQVNHKLPFRPLKFYVYTMAGETDTIYHCWVKFDEKDEKYTSLFIPKRALFQPLLTTVWADQPVNVEELNKKLLNGSGRTLKGHQVEGVKFILANKKCILADSQGLGKTMTAIAATIDGNFKTLIIAPAAVKNNWAREIGFFGVDDISIVEGTDRERYDTSGKYVICNYDIFDGEDGKGLHTVVYDTVIDEYTGKPKQVKSRNKAKIAEVTAENPLMQAKFDCIIIDESHKLANSTSKRYKAILDFVKRSKIEYVVLLSGTPLNGSHHKFYNQLCLIDAEITKNWVYYMDRYCGAKKMRLSTGREILSPRDDTNYQELFERVKHLYLRRLKEEVITLPPRYIYEKYYDLDLKQRGEYDQLWDDYEKAQLEDGKNITTLNKELVSGSLYRQYLAKEMIPNTINLAEEHIKNNSKVVVFCCFNEEIDILKDYFGDTCVTFTGSMNLKKKDEAVLNFNTNPNVNVIILNIVAGGTGITLISQVEGMKSDTLIFNSFSYVDSDLMQAMDRCYRIGVTWEVTTYIQMFKNTHCQYVYNTVLRKKLSSDNIIKSENEK
jgi:SWI/SNF-related matrix-associated actin-dependent regulator 1 of chromatin subfamily A